MSKRNRQEYERTSTTTTTEHEGEDKDNNDNDKDSMNSKVHPPKRTNPSIVHTLSLLNPFGRSLTTALDTLQHTQDDDGDSSSSSTIMNDTIRQDIIQGYQLAMEEELNDLLLQNTGPAGMIRGNILHYNRFGGQWRFRLEAGSLMLAPRCPNKPSLIATVGSIGSKKWNLWGGVEQHAVELCGDLETDVLVFDDTVE